MAAAMVAFIAGPGFLPHFRGVPKQALLHPLRTFFSKPYPNNLFLRSSSNGIRRRPFFIPIGPFSPVMEWQDCSAKLDIDVPCSIAYECYSDRESIPKWMPFISSVKPIPNQKIHWRSLEGLPNRGAVRFFPKGPSACTVELSISYEVPQILVPVASALKPLLESLLLNGLERFANVAKDYQEKISIR